MAWKRKKKPLEDEERNVADPDRAREKTMHRAVKLLAAKPRSIAELRERLLEKPWTNAEIVDDVLKKLEDYKYLDDQQFAKSSAESKLRESPVGRHRLRQSLTNKKLDKETIDQAIETAFENTPEDEVIDRAIRKRLRLKGKPETREDAKKFYDYLLRQGFSYDLIASKMRDVTAGRFEEDQS